MDHFEAWVRLMISHLRQQCLEDVYEMGRPGQIRFTRLQYLRDEMETLEDVIEYYRIFNKETE